MYRYLLMSLIASVTITDLVIGKNSIACFGTGNCSFSHLQCTNKDVVQLTDLQYGYKLTSECQEPSTVCDAFSPTCCKDGKSDCKDDFTNTHRKNMYEKCSGRDWNCSTQAPQAYIDCDGESSESSESQVLSTHAIMSYKCVKKSKIQIGCNEGYIKNNEVYLMLNNFSGCSGLFCTATSSRFLEVTAVDVRLQRPDGECSSTHLRVNNINLECNETSFFFKHLVLKKVKTVEINISKMPFDTPSMIWIKLKASEKITLKCTPYDTPTTPSPTRPADVNPPAAQTSDANDSTPIIVSVVLVVLLVAVASIALVLWRKRNLFPKPKLRSIFHIGNSRKSHNEKQTNNYIDPDKIPGDRQQKQNNIFAISLPPAGNYFELEPQYVEPEVRNSTYAEIREDGQPENEIPALPDYDKLRVQHKISVPSERVNNEYSHITINEDQTPYSHIGKMDQCKDVNRKPLSEYSHVQPATQGFPSEVHDTKADGRCNPSDISEYSHLANCRHDGMTEAGETEEEDRKYKYDRKNLSESDTYSHIHTSKA